MGNQGKKFQKDQTSWRFISQVSLPINCLTFASKIQMLWNFFTAIKGAVFEKL